MTAIKGLATLDDRHAYDTKHENEIWNLSLTSVIK